MAETPSDACEELVEAVGIAIGAAEFVQPEVAARMLAAAKQMCALCAANCTQAMCRGDYDSSVKNIDLAKLIRQAEHYGLAEQSEGDPEEDYRQRPYFWELVTEG